MRHFSLLILLILLSLSTTVAYGQVAKSPRSALGTLKVWVPAGMIGDDYWIYLNERLKSGPPHGSTDPRSHDFMTVSVGPIGSNGHQESKDGWDIWTSEGLILRMRHEIFDSRLASYIDSAAGDELHVFKVFELQLHPDKYTVEIAILSRGGSSASPFAVNSFPFVVTQKYVADVRPGQITKLYTGVPDDWSETRLAQAMRVDRLCPDGAAPPDFAQLQHWVKDYVDDPVVKSLHDVNASSFSPPKGVVVLNLPSAQGGPREFDGSQITYIVDAILAHHNLPSHDEVAACQGRFPQFSRSYAAYDKMMSSIDTDIASFRKLAADLGRGQ
jgi:hypothetical protein